MRTTKLIALLLLAALVLSPLAAAAGGDRGKAERARGAEAADDHEDGEKTHAERSWRGWMDENATANHTARIDAFLAQMKAIRDAWKENATQIRETCKDLRAAEDDNTTSDDHKANAHCIRDGYRAWRADHRADVKDLREEFRAIMQGMRGFRGAHE